MQRLLFGLKFLLRRFGLGFWTLQQDIQTVNKELKSVAVAQLQIQQDVRDSFKQVHESLSDVHGEFFSLGKALRSSVDVDARIDSELSAVRADTLAIRAELKEVWAFLHRMPESCLQGDCPLQGSLPNPDLPLGRSIFKSEVSNL